jgi:hypothetical protein
MSLPHQVEYNHLVILVLLHNLKVVKVIIHHIINNFLIYCWVLEVLASFLLIQILLFDVGYNVPTSWHGSVCLVYVLSCTHTLPY